MEYDSLDDLIRADAEIVWIRVDLDDHEQAAGEAYYEDGASSPFHRHRGRWRFEACHGGAP